MNRRNRLWAGGAAALGAGVLLAGPLRAIAQDDDNDWVSEALDGLVADGTITQQQADAVDQALDEARPERGPRGDRGHHGPFGRFGPAGRGVGLEAAAEAIGIEQDALRDALRDGQTIAEVAEANGVDVQVVIDAMVAAAQERIDEAIADVDERLADLRADHRARQRRLPGASAPSDRGFDRRLDRRLGGPHDADHGGVSGAAIRATACGGTGGTGCPNSRRRAPWR